MNDECNLTLLGEMMSEFPLDPQMAKMLIDSPTFGCSSEILSISAMLSVPNCFVCPSKGRLERLPMKPKLSSLTSAEITSLNIYHAFQLNNEDSSWCYDNFLNYSALKSVDNVRQQLARIMSRYNLRIRSNGFHNRDYYVNIREAILQGYFMQVARLDRIIRQYRTVKDNQIVHLHSSKSLDHNPDWVVYDKWVVTNRSYIRTTTAICGEWLADIEKSPDEMR